MKIFIGYPILHCVIREVEIQNHISLCVERNNLHVTTYSIV